MAELLVRIKDKVNPDFYLNAQCGKRGDVIAVQPDGWSWSPRERTNPEWMIVQFPGVPVAEFSDLLMIEPEPNPDQPSRTRQRRAFKLDVDALGIAEPVVPEGLSTPERRLLTRADAVRVYDTIAFDVRAHTIAKAPIPDKSNFA